MLTLGHITYVHVIWRLYNQPLQIIQMCSFVHFHSQVHSIELTTFEALVALQTR